MPHEEEDRSVSEEPEEEEEDSTINNGSVVEKYKTAGTFCNNALKEILAAAKAGVSVLSLAELGDNLILSQTEKVFNKGKGADRIEKGLAFPTCINVNQAVCHNSPTPEDPEQLLANGDVVRIDLGCHIDGFSAVLAHTVYIQEDPSAPLKASPESNVLAAAAAAQDAITHMFRPGTKNSDITNIIEKIAKDFDVTPVEGVVSHELKRYIVDGVNVIANKNVPDQTVSSHELEEATVWSLDIVFSSAPYGERENSGKLRQKDSKVNVYKRSLHEYQLKMKASREVFSEINKRFQSFPFSMRHLDSKKGRFCINECLKHDLVNPYPVLFAKNGEHIAQFKSTILIRPTVIEKVTGVPHQVVETDKKIQDKEVIEATSRSLQLKSKKKKKAKKPAASA